MLRELISMTSTLLRGDSNESIHTGVGTGEGGANLGTVRFIGGGGHEGGHNAFQNYWGGGCPAPTP